MTYLSKVVNKVKLVGTLGVLFLCAGSVFAEDPICKSRNGEVKVAYPELARRMKISGTVRIQIQLNASGGVRSSKVVGGNPVLASAAQDAVKQAKFEGTDTCIAVFEFK